MVNQICALPARCSSCGAIFDLSYDLGLEGDSVYDLLKILKVSKNKELLCWKCRNL